MLGAVFPESFSTLHSYTNLLKVPFLMPWFPEKVNPQNGRVDDLAFSLTPDYHRAIIDTIILLGWKHVIFLYDSNDGLLRLEQVYKHLSPGQAMFQITHTRRVSSALDVITFLVGLENLNRWTNKYVVLDCGTPLAKEVLVHHVRNVTLGRRNYHYLLSGLVMDDLRDKNITEFGAINVTGFQILDHSSKNVQNFFESWPRDYISAQGALMYDLVQVLHHSLKKMVEQYPDFLRNNKSVSADTSSVHHQAGIECYGDILLYPAKYGERFAQVIKGTEIEGITGLIRFNKDGHRQNFTLQIVQMTVSGDIVKIGTWYDYKDYVPLLPKSILKDLGQYLRNKTYVISTIAEYPFVIQDTKPDNPEQLPQLRGFCVDLTRLLMKKMDVTYTLKLGKDRRYGTENPDSSDGWDGLVGELLRKEVDLVVAPLEILHKRQEVVDFSMPFMTFNKHKKKPEIWSYESMFSFLNPMTLQLWLTILGSLIVTSIVLSLVSRLESNQWSKKQDGREGNMRIANIENQIATIDTRPVTRVVRINFSNAAWFCIQKLFHQNSNQYSPRSHAVRIVVGVWVFFAMIITLNFMANMTAYMTVSRIRLPLGPQVVVTKCPKDKYSMPLSQGEDGDHPWQGFVPGSGDQEEDCDLMLSNLTPGDQKYAIAFPKNSILRDCINMALQELHKAGEIEQLVRQWFIDTQCGFPTTLNNEELALNEVSGLFIILVTGLLLACVIWLFELVIRKRSMKRSELAMMNRSDGNEPGDDQSSSPRRRSKSQLNTPSVDIDMEQIEWSECCSEFTQQEEREGPASIEDIELGPMYDHSDRSADEAEDARPTVYRRARRAAPVELHWL
ncbi:glutamate receptor 1-like [Bicyclus anynana]|uniref:Glutamate receptor 1-like n=1 Tax=Bicyclus anynana TaxID=110368 RepID=A0ABM3M562_BICAN|nr:glutamate receptor 1-like [Bicyclus anynana]